MVMRTVKKNLVLTSHLLYESHKQTIKNYYYAFNVTWSIVEKHFPSLRYRSLVFSIHVLSSHRISNGTVRPINKKLSRRRKFLYTHAKTQNDPREHLRHRWMEKKQFSDSLCNATRFFFSPFPSYIKNPTHPGRSFKICCFSLTGRVFFISRGSCWVSFLLLFLFKIFSFEIYAHFR